MSILVGQMSFQGKSGLPKDRFVNTFHAFVDGAPTPTKVGILSAIVGSFYNDLQTGQVVRVAQYLSPAIARGSGKGHKLRWYDLADDLPRVPLTGGYEDFYLGGSTPAAGFPEETAACLSYAAGIVSGDVAARNRGRLFIGPLATTCATYDTNTQPRPSTEFRSDLTKAAVFMFTSFTAGTDYIGQYSPTNDIIQRVKKVWVDDAFDVIRGRGAIPTTRTIATV